MADGLPDANRKPLFPSRSAMVILSLILILAGASGGAIILWLQDASLWQIALGYVAGGWAGLLAGLPVVLALRALYHLIRSESPSALASKRPSQHQQKTLP